MEEARGGGLGWDGDGSGEAGGGGGGGGGGSLLSVTPGPSDEQVLRVRVGGADHPERWSSSEEWSSLERTPSGPSDHDPPHHLMIRPFVKTVAL